MTLRSLGDVVLVLWAVPAILAPLLYLDVRDVTGRRFAFRTSPMGRHLMAYMSAMAVMATLGLVRLVFDDGPVWAALRVVGFLGVVAVTWWRLLVVARARTESRAARRDRIP